MTAMLSLLLFLTVAVIVWGVAAFLVGLLVVMVMNNQAGGGAATDSVDHAFRKRDLYGYLGEDELVAAGRDLTRYVETLR